jgi:hypothetical protein
VCATVQREQPSSRHSSIDRAGRVSTGALDDIRRVTDMAYKAVAEYGLNQGIGPISLATLSNGGLDDSGGSPFGRDQVCLKTIPTRASQRSMRHQILRF